jgi:hypothetical protein
MASQELRIKLSISKATAVRLRVYYFSTCQKRFASTGAWSVPKQVVDLTITMLLSRKDIRTTSTRQNLLLICTRTLVKSTRLMVLVTLMKSTKTLAWPCYLRSHLLSALKALERLKLGKFYVNAPI